MFFFYRCPLKVVGVGGGACLLATCSAGKNNLVACLLLESCLFLILLSAMIGFDENFWQEMIGLIYVLNLYWIFFSSNFKITHKEIGFDRLKLKIKEISWRVTIKNLL